MTYTHPKTHYHVRRQRNAGPNQGKWRVHAPGGMTIGPACESRRQALWLAGVCALAESKTGEPATCLEIYFDSCSAYNGDSGPLYPRKGGKIVSPAKETTP